MFNAKKLAAAPAKVGSRYESPLLFPGVFGKRQCQKIIDLGLGQARESGLISTGAASKEDSAARLAEISWLSPGEGNDWIFEKLAKTAERANRKLQFKLSGFTEEAQFTCYDQPDAFYDWHQDGLEGDLATRKLSLVVQLSDPDEYRGCDLDLFSLSCDPAVAASWKDDLRAQGTVIAFPAFEFHRVTPLLDGRRYSLVCWIGGPAFR